MSENTLTRKEKKELKNLEDISKLNRVANEYETEKVNKKTKKIKNKFESIEIKGENFYLKDNILYLKNFETYAELLIKDKKDINYGFIKLNKEIFKIKEGFYIYIIKDFNNLENLKQKLIYNGLWFVNQKIS